MERLHPGSARSLVSAAGTSGLIKRSREHPIGTAGAIATAPFRNDVCAYNDGYSGRRYYGGYNNGFVCQPGTTFIGEDGRRHICQ